MKKSVTIYVNWGEQTIYSESELADAKNDRIDEMYNDERAFYEWLNDNYSASEVFTKDRDELDSNWQEYCEARVDEEWEDFEEIDLDIDVDIDERDYIF